MAEKHKDEFPGATVFAYQDFYLFPLVTDVIVYELPRNLGLSLASIFVTTFILLFNCYLSVLVAISVLMTLTCVVGYMHFMGDTLNIITCFFITVAMGLSVDYSAHIAHAFLVSKDQVSEKKVTAALLKIGPAVFNGGFSTLLAFSPLMLAKDFIAKLFFRVFALVVLFGLFNGLFFVPAVLGLLNCWHDPQQVTIGEDDKENTQNSNAVKGAMLGNDATGINQNVNADNALEEIPKESPDNINQELQAQPQTTGEPKTVEVLPKLQDGAPVNEVAEEPKVNQENEETVDVNAKSNISHPISDDNKEKAASDHDKHKKGHHHKKHKHHKDKHKHKHKN